jgi:hypothetical protein
MKELSGQKGVGIQVRLDSEQERVETYWQDYDF